MASPMTLPAWFGPFRKRPKLVIAIALGALTLLACRGFGLQWATSALLGWDALCGGYIGMMLVSMAGRTPDDIRARAAYEDQGRPMILALVVCAAVAAIVAIALELSIAKDAHGVERALRVVLAFGTVALSWFMVHLIFALHYAHGFYDRADLDGQRPRRKGEKPADAGGLQFPGGEAPDYWDFLHFAVIIGVAAQTADIAVTAKRLRRLNTVHALFAFSFNTVVVALTINLLASLFGD